MGLFGRDDRSQRDAAAEPARPPRHEAPPPPRERGDQTVIAPTVRIEGTLAGDGEILVSGKVKGTIDGAGSIHVAERGQVTAAVHGRTVTVAGTVKGNITADERIELEPTARVDGDITAPRILIKDGATFKGQVNMKSPPAPSGAAASAARKTS